MHELQNRIQERLTRELTQFKELVDLPQNLDVIWIPDQDNSLSGEVKGTHVLIYEADVEKAVKTLHHELIDLLVSQAIEPYKNVTNLLIRKLNDDAYHRKEKIVDALLRMLDFKNRAS